MLNTVTISGRVTTAPTKFKEINGESFYSFELEYMTGSNLNRLDTVEVGVSERVSGFNLLKVNSKVEVSGSIRSRVNRDKSQPKPKIITVIFVDEVRNFAEWVNNMKFVGTVRDTGFLKEFSNSGKRFCRRSLLLRRMWDKETRVSIVAWGRNANYLNRIKEGEKIHCEGHLTSHTYEYRDRGTYRRCKAWEVSVNTLYIEE